MAKYSKITEESTPEVTSRSINIFLVILKLSIACMINELRNRAEHVLQEEPVLWLEERYCCSMMSLSDDDSLFLQASQQYEATVFNNQSCGDEQDDCGLDDSLLMQASHSYEASIEAQATKQDYDEFAEQWLKDYQTYERLGEDYFYYDNLIPDKYKMPQPPLQSQTRFSAPV